MTGRPTKYNDEMQSKAEHYVDDYESFGHAFPSVIGLAEYLDVNRATIYRWTDPSFRDILDKIETVQHNVAWNKGLRGEYNANLVKLLLGKHGYSEQQKIEQNTNLSVSELSDKDLEGILSDAANRGS